MTPASLIALGVLAGLLTTVAGMGGGILLVLALSLSGDPKAALAATAPALLLGNLHRAVMFRASIDRGVARSFSLGALPGSVAGGLFLSVVPDGIVRGLMLALTALAVGRAAGIFSFRPPASAMAPAGFGIGAMAATAGGAGLLAGPLLLSAGLTGAAYISTSAACAVAMHAGRMLAYGAGGLFTLETLRASAALTAAILAGNALGKRARRLVPEAWATRIEIGTCVACVGLAAAGVR